MAIGGQIIVPIRDANGNKVKITSTPVNIKPGTFNKVARAMEMQKELVFEDLIVPDRKISSFSSAFLIHYITTPDYYAFRIVVSDLTTSGTGTNIEVVITSTDTAFTL